MQVLFLKFSFSTRGLDLWRSKAGGRIVFEITVDYSETHRCWQEMIR